MSRNPHRLPPPITPSGPPLTAAEDAALAPLRPLLGATDHISLAYEADRRRARPRPPAQWWDAFFAEFGGGPQSGTRDDAPL